MRYTLIFTVMLVVASCGYVSPLAPYKYVPPLAPEIDDTIAKEFKPISGKSIIYVFRELAGPPWYQVPIALNGVPAGTIRKETYFRWIVEPGTHVVSTEFESYEFETLSASIELETEEENIYFVWVDTTFGIPESTSDFHLVDAARGKKSVRESALLTNLFY